VVLFVTFTGWSLGIVQSQGLGGLLSVLQREPWSVQVLVDLVITSVVAWAWLRVDARAQGIAGWPYMLATACAGSIGVLAYLIHRELALRRVVSRG
jgi:hypothetical protein